MEMFKEILFKLLCACFFGFLAWFLKTRKQYLLGLVTVLIQQAETSVQGSGLGADKKKLVIAQLDMAGVKMTAWLSMAIDDIVAELNDKKAWFTENAKDTLSVGPTTT